MNECMAEMPRYECHKKVWAFKIASIRSRANKDTESDGSMVIHPAEPGYSPFIVDAEYVRKHRPKEGGYYVVYEGGYKSFSPAEAFETGYTRI